MEMEFSMAHVWFYGDDDIWSAMPLDGHAVDVSVFPPVTLGENFQLGEDAQAALMRTDGDSPSWVLVVAPGGDMRVNGFAPVAGVRALQDRDEVRAAASAPFFFSTETLARVEEFPGTERTVYCGRCRQAMEKGQLAVITELAREAAAAARAALLKQTAVTECDVYLAASRMKESN
jgi:hypothetical protein